MNTRKH